MVGFQQLTRMVSSTPTDELQKAVGDQELKISPGKLDVLDSLSRIHLQLTMTLSQKILDGVEVFSVNCLKLSEF
jgi:hypothetical protein